RRPTRSTLLPYTTLFRSPLRGVDDQQRTLAGRERARDLVGEVDVARRVDQMQLIGLPVGSAVEDPHSLRLDRDAALALELHRIEHLCSHLASGHRVRELEDAIGKRGLAVVDVRDDRKVADLGLLHGRYSLDALAFVIRRIAHSAKGPQPSRGNAPTAVGGQSRWPGVSRRPGNDTKSWDAVVQWRFLSGSRAS